MSWIWQGRQLVTAEKDGTTLSYTYDSEGIRTSKTVGSATTKYLLNGTQILAQATNGTTLSFFYDQQGKRVGMADGNNKFYYYIYNLQGDVIALADASTGKLVVTYTYDAWGKPLSVTDKTSNSVGTQNPFRYRGYYYDTETSLYYLQTRYYDPEVGRFINADAFTSTDISSPLGTNMFAYCENNPIMRSDPTGELFGAISGVIIGGLTGALSASLNGGDVLAGALTGALNGGICGAIAESAAFTVGAAVVACGVVGVVCDVINQAANGTKVKDMDLGSIILSGAFSALSCGMSKGVEKLMGEATKAEVNFATTIRGTSTSLVGVGVSNIHDQNQKKRQNTKKQDANAERWKRMTEHYRSQVVK